MAVATRVLLFAISAVAISMLIDLALWGGYQGMEPANQRESLLVVHGLMHAVLFVAGVAGALLPFLFLRHRLPSLKAVSGLGFVFGVIGIFSAAATIIALGPVVAGVVLLVAAGFVTGAGGFFFRSKGG